MKRKVGIAVNKAKHVFCQDPALLLLTSHGPSFLPSVTYCISWFEQLIVSTCAFPSVTINSLGSHLPCKGSFSRSGNPSRSSDIHLQRTALIPRHPPSPQHQALQYIQLHNTTCNHTEFCEFLCCLTMPHFCPGGDE